MTQESISQAVAAAVSPEIIRETVAAYFAAIRAMDAGAFANCFVADGATHDPVGTPPHIGHAAIHRFFDGIVGLFETVGLTEDAVFVAGNGAAAKWMGHGHGKNGVEVTFEGVDVIELNATGKIQVVHAYWDPAPMLGAVTGA